MHYEKLCYFCHFSGKHIGHLGSVRSHTQPVFVFSRMFIKACFATCACLNPTKCSQWWFWTNYSHLLLYILPLFVLQYFFDILMCTVCMYMCKPRCYVYITCLYSCKGQRVLYFYTHGKNKTLFEVTSQGWPITGYHSFVAVLILSSIHLNYIYVCKLLGLAQYLRINIWTVFSVHE